MHSLAIVGYFHRQLVSHTVAKSYSYAMVKDFKLKIHIYVKMCLKSYLKEEIALIISVAFLVKWTFISSVNNQHIQTANLLTYKTCCDHHCPNFLVMSLRCASDALNPVYLNFKGLHAPAFKNVYFAYCTVPHRSS